MRWRWWITHDECEEGRNGEAEIRLVSELVDCLGEHDDWTNELDTGITKKQYTPRSGAQRIWAGSQDSQNWFMWDHGGTAFCICSRADLVIW